MWGSNLATPWSPTNSQYRQNVIIFVEATAGARRASVPAPLDAAFTDGEAGDWWREVALYTDFVREVYFNSPPAPRTGAGSRLADSAQRVPPGRDRPDRDRDPALEDRDLPRLPHEPGPGRPRGTEAGERLVQHDQARRCSRRSRCSREIPFATIWSWGWGEWAASDRDPDKPAAACVYLWTRDHRLCDGPPVAGPGFDRRLTVGQLNLPPGAQCTTPWGRCEAASWRASPGSPATARSRSRRSSPGSC